MFVEHHPAGPLGLHIESIWFAAREALPHRRERALPTGRVDIVIPLQQDGVLRYDSLDAAQPRLLRGGVVVGVHDRFFVRGTGGASTVIGVHFRPGGAAAFFGGALPDLRNRTAPLEAVWGRAASDLREQLLAARTVGQKIALVEQALLARRAEPTEGDRMVALALDAFSRDPASARVDVVQEASGCSPQRFNRCFEAAVGITPKRYARVLRFTALLPRLARPGLRDGARLAAEGGYSDQSHLIHEFVRLAGMTPGDYRPVQADRPSHVAIDDVAAEIYKADRRRRG